MKVQEALNQIIKQGWEVHRRTSHGQMLRRRADGTTVPFAYIAHSKELGNTQLRMLSKKFELNPPLIDAHLQPEVKPVAINATAVSPNLKIVPMSMKDVGWRVTQAMDHLDMSDDRLAELMGRDIPWVVDLKKGRANLSAEEVRALVGVFGRTAEGKLSTRWYKSRKGSGNRSRGTMGGPPLVPAPWVIEAERNKQLAATRPPAAPVPLTQPTERAVSERPVIPETTPRPAAVQPIVEGEAKPTETYLSRVEAAEKQISDGIDLLFNLVNEMAEEIDELRKEAKDHAELDAAIELVQEIAARRKR